MIATRSIDSREKRNNEYLAMLDESEAQFKAGNTITFTMEELKEMESEDWKPSQKILDFERKNHIKRPEVTNDE
ncbi:MAG: hypothetical protein NC302_06065 [Bacteroidales bacterium]|nr:hypothetical protein [Bacteroidales bacterium]MCM1416686.1 hypothetical protein [bacterium]MCM1424005.1 hypothetical protein [bacterium]